MIEMGLDGFGDDDEDITGLLLACLHDREESFRQITG